MVSVEVPDNAWHLDKKVPVALIIVISVQLIGGGMWLSRIESRIADAIATNIEQAAEITALRSEGQRMAVSGATVAAQLQGVRESLTELKDAQRETNNLLRELSQRGMNP